MRIALRLPMLRAAVLSPKGVSVIGGEFSKTVSDLSKAVHSALTDVIPHRTRVAHIDHPCYPNVGDHAIWLGERDALRRLQARRVYVCSVETYDRNHVAAAIGDGLILIHGGGNFGDLWPRHQRLREQIIQDFPNNRIIQFPQSIWFDDRANASTIRKCMEVHGGVTLMVRDRQSLRLARDLLDIDAVLCPDGALALGPIERTDPPSRETILLMRRDKEAKRRFDDVVASNLIGRSDQEVDSEWIDCGSVEAFLGEADALYPRAFRPKIAWKLRRVVYDQQSSMSLRRGARILSKGRKVVTDRLHGFILCLLLRIPVIPLDNSYGKISSFISTWFADEQIALFEERARSWAGS